MFGGVDDELFGGLVEVGGALQEAGAGDAEAVQGVLDCAGELAGMEIEGWFACGWGAWAGVAGGDGGGAGGGQDVAGGAEGGGCFAGVGGGFGGGFGGVLAQG